MLMIASLLRDVLQEGSRSHPVETSSQLPHLLIEHDTLSFSKDSDFELDLSTLQTAFTLARRRSVNEAAVDLQARLVQWQAAVALYRGNFLDGFSLPEASDFEDWLLLQREAWHRRANTVFDRLSQLQSEGGELYLQLDDGERAHAVFGKAATIVQRLAETIGDEKQKMKFLEASVVKRIKENVK